MGLHSGKTFLAEPLDVYFKLLWEYTQLASADRLDRPQQAYMALNAAMTAWHMADWLCARMTPEHYAKLRGATGNKDLNNCKAFRAWAQKRESITVCEQIAVSAKHWTINEESGLKVTTSEVDLTNLDGKQLWIPMVEGGRSKAPMTIIIGLALSFWRTVLIDIAMATHAQLERPPKIN